jgi:hypothetical protein
MAPLGSEDAFMEMKSTLPLHALAAMPVWVTGAVSLSSFTRTMQKSAPGSLFPAWTAFILVAAVLFAYACLSPYAAMLAIPGVIAFPVLHVVAMRAFRTEAALLDARLHAPLHVPEARTPTPRVGALAPADSTGDSAGYVELEREDADAGYADGEDAYAGGARRDN